MFENTLWVTKELSFIDKIDLMVKIDGNEKYNDITDVVSALTGEVLISRDIDLHTWRIY